MNTASICAERCERIRAGHPRDPAWCELIEQRDSALRLWKERGLTTRLARTLADGGVWSLIELGEMPPVDLLRIEDIGLGALSTIDELLGRKPAARDSALPALNRRQQAIVDRWSARVGAARVAEIATALAEMTAGDTRSHIMAAITGLLRVEAARRVWAARRGQG